MLDPELLLSSAIKSILLAYGRQELPTGMEIRAQGDMEPEERPYLVAFCENTTSPHPQLRQTTLVLRLITRADEQTVEQAARWHAAAVSFLVQNPATVHATLEPLGLTVKTFREENSAVDEIAGRASHYDQRWRVWMQIADA